MSKAPGQTYANQQKIKAAKEQQRIFEWRKRRPDLTAAEFDEAVRLHDLRLVLISTGQSFEIAEYARFMELHPFAVIDLDQGANCRFTVAFRVNWRELREPSCPQIFRSRQPAQKLADWLCVMWRTCTAPRLNAAPSEPAAEHSTAACYSFETGACEPVPSILKKQAE